MLAFRPQTFSIALVKNQTSLSGKSWTSAPKLSSLEELFSHILPNSDESFLQPRLKDLHDPLLMAGMDTAVTRIQQAIDEKERIMVYGDFDTDGITSTVILVQALRDLGGIVSYRIPCRVNDSHGLKNHHIDEIASKDVGLIITCDCGINDHQEVSHAKSLGLDVIITDHHDPDPERFPNDATAVLNPLQHNCNYPCKTLSGAGVALKLVQALQEAAKQPSNQAAKSKHSSVTRSLGHLKTYLDIAAIGLIADCVPLTGESRTMAKLGLQQLKQTQWSGLQQLLTFTDTDTNEIDENTVGFTIGPRLNAASRIGDVTRAVELFLGDSSKHLQRIEYLEQLNTQRKQRTEETLTQALKQIDETQSCQLLYHPEWEQGILGLVAGRIYEKIDQPVILARQAGEKIAASCRAPAGYSMITALRAIEDLLGKYGGHDGAAGFEAPLENKDLITQRLHEYFLGQERAESEIKIQAALSANLINYATADFLQSLAPFGVGNQAPIFSFQQTKIISKQWMGQTENHFKITGIKDDQVFEFLVFFRPEWFSQILEESTVNIAFNLNESWWRGERQLKLKVVDLRTEAQY